MFLLGVRREDRNRFERRTPLTPDHVAQLAGEHGVQVTLQPSPKRIFTDNEYREVGGIVAEGLHACQVILGIKEVPLSKLLSCKTYVFFSHTIKGQEHNMPLLQRMMDLGCTLMDYEKITDDDGRRLLFFGRHAGLAGVIDSLWALGQRLDLEGFSTPLDQIRRGHEYDSLAEAKEHITEVGKLLNNGGLPDALRPMVFGVTGYGNVSAGAQEMLDLLGLQTVEPRDLRGLSASDGPLVKVVFREEHMVQPPADFGAFDLQHYYDNPEGYEPVFHRYLPHLSMLINCIYWTPCYPRLVTKQQLRALYAEGAPKLRVIGDISCDVEGSIEATMEARGPGNPVYVYDVHQDRVVDSVGVTGPVIMAVENLPAELPREASKTFSTALINFVPDLVAADFTGTFEQSNLPGPLRRATVLFRGELTPDFAYLQEHLDRASGSK